VRINAPEADVESGRVVLHDVRGRTHGWRAFLKIV
jgi:hypothetical protein